jgi:hypothetical protein
MLCLILFPCLLSCLCYGFYIGRTDDEDGLTTSQGQHRHVRSCVDLYPTSNDAPMYEESLTDAEKERLLATVGEWQHVYKVPVRRSSMEVYFHMSRWSALKQTWAETFHSEDDILLPAVTKLYKVDELPNPWIV